MNGENNSGSARRLGVGFIGSGFNARFHMQGFRSVRDADVLGVWSPNKKNAAWPIDTCPPRPIRRFMP